MLPTVSVLAILAAAAALAPAQAARPAGAITPADMPAGQCLTLRAEYGAEIVPPSAAIPPRPVGLEFTAAAGPCAEAPASVARTSTQPGACKCAIRTAEGVIAVPLPSAVATLDGEAWHCGDDGAWSRVADAGPWDTVYDAGRGSAVVSLCP